MKLAEALIARAGLQKKAVSLRHRIAANVRVQEGDQPPENPSDLFSELAATLGDLTGLVVKINNANTRTLLPEPRHRTMTQGLADRAQLMQLHAALSEAIEAASERPNTFRLGRSEIKWVLTVKVRDLQEQADGVAKDLRELNAAIQQANWQADL